VIVCDLVLLLNVSAFCAKFCTLTQGVNGAKAFACGVRPPSSAECDCESARVRFEIELPKALREKPAFLVFGVYEIMSSWVTLAGMSLEWFWASACGRYVQACALRAKFGRHPQGFLAFA
jgi:hypothetical protein